MPDSPRDEARGLDRRTGPAPPVGFALDVRRAALVVTDPQVDFLSPVGIAWSVVGTSVEQNGTVENIERLLETVRDADMPIAISPPPSTSATSPTRSGVPTRRCGTSGAGPEGHCQKGRDMQARRPTEDDRRPVNAVAVEGVPVESVLVERWWAVALRGAASVLFGLVALFWPGVTFVALVLLFGAYALVDGVFALVAAIAQARARRRRWPLVLEGVLGIAAGLVTLFYPGITAIALLAVIAAWAIVGGIFEIVEAVRLRRQIEGEWLLGLAGALSVVFGVLVVLFPGAGAASVVWLLGAYAIAFGAALIALAFRLRNAARLLERLQR